MNEIRKNMVSFYGTFLNGVPPQSEWANSVNQTLDDAISKSDTPVDGQSIASPLTLSGIVTMGADWDLGTNSLLVTYNGVKTITPLSLSYLVGLDQFLTKTSPVVFTGLTITGKAGVLRAESGVIKGNATPDGFTTTDHLLEGTGNLYYTPLRIDTLIKNNTGISWVYVDTAGSETLTPTLDDIELTQIKEGLAGQIIVADSNGYPNYVTMQGDASIDEAGVVTIADDSSHTHNTSYYTESQIDAFFIDEVSGKKQVAWDDVYNPPATFIPATHDLMAKHTIVSSIVGAVLRVNAVNSFEIAKLSHGKITGTDPYTYDGDLIGFTEDDHHSKSHDIGGSEHSGSLSYTQLSGLVDTSGSVGEDDKVSRADHIHGGAAGSGKAGYGSLSDIPDEFPPEAHTNHKITLGYNPTVLYVDSANCTVNNSSGLYTKVTNCQVSVPYPPDTDWPSDWVLWELPVIYNKRCVAIHLQGYYTNISVLDIFGVLIYKLLNSSGNIVTYAFNPDGVWNWVENPSTNDLTTITWTGSGGGWTATPGNSYFMKLWADTDDEWRIERIYLEWEDFNTN